MPIAATVFVIAGLASLGLPTMSGFVAELLVFLGSFDSLRDTDHHRGYRHLAVGRLHPLDGAARVWFGPAQERWAELTDTINWWERVAWRRWSP